MEISKEPFRRPRRRDLLQFLELRFKLAFEILIVELVGLHHMAVSVDNLDAVEHGSASASSDVTYRASQHRNSSKQGPAPAPESGGGSVVARMIKRRGN